MAAVGVKAIEKRSPCELIEALGYMEPRNPQSPALLEVRYYETYFIANAINNVLADPVPYLRNLDEFYGDLSYVRLLPVFKKWSVFHDFIEFIVESLIFEQIRDADVRELVEEAKRFEEIRPTSELRRLPLNKALVHYGIPHKPFDEWLEEQGIPFDDADEDAAHDYYSYLSEDGAYWQLLEQVVEEVFFVMFSNRQALARFHELAAGVIAQVEIAGVDDEHRQCFVRDGVLRRCSIPTWAQKAVFFRDRGRCVLCQKDLSNLLSLQNSENYDHIVPLARGGINDVTNLQLLCSECNHEKAAKEPRTSVLYERWY